MATIRYSREDKVQWKHDFDEKINYAAENIFDDWYSFDYETVVEYTHWLDYPKKETRKVPIKIKLFVLNLRLIFNSNVDFEFDGPTRRFIRNHRAYRKEMGPIIGWNNAPFIGSKVQNFLDTFIKSKSTSDKDSRAMRLCDYGGRAVRKDNPVLLYFNKNASYDGKNWHEEECPKLMERIKANMGNLKAKYVHTWVDAMEHKKFYSSSGYYSHPDYRYSDFIITTSQLNADILRVICSSIVGSNCQELENRGWHIPIRPTISTHAFDTHYQYLSMVRGCDHVPNFTILALDYDITSEEFLSLIENNPSQKVKFAKQIERENIILEEHRKQIEEAAQKQEQELKAKREEEERRRFNRHNGHYRDSDIRFDSQTQQYTCCNQKLDNLKFFINTLFPNFDKTKYLERRKMETNQDYETILKQWKEKAERTKQQERELRSNIEYWFRTGHVLSNKSFVLFKEFADNQGIFPFRTNWHIYDLDTRIAGSVDFATQNNDGTLILYALTTRSHIIDNGIPIKNNEDNITAKEPISNIPDTLYYRFAVELNMLKYILETHYGYMVNELRLGVFNENNSKPYILRIPILKSETDKLIELRSDIIF